MATPREKGKPVGMPFPFVAVALWHRYPRCIVATALAAATFLAIVWSTQRSGVGGDGVAVLGEDLVATISLSGRLESFPPETQMVWQIPASPKAVLFLAHGCGCRATFFWDSGPGCAGCEGLPEERRLVVHALARGYATVAVSSAGPCWSIRQDRRRVVAALRHWVDAHRLAHLPAVALGASSGGYFVSALALAPEPGLNLSAICIMIAEGILATSPSKITPNYPPPLFVHMPKDHRRAIAIKNTLSLLRSKGIDTDEIQCLEFPITPQLFTRIPGLSKRTSEQIYHALKDGRVLSKSGYMTMDGRSVDWKSIVWKKDALPADASGKLKWEAHVQELLNLAYAYHEMTSLESDRIFQWFDSHLPSEEVSI